MLRDSNPSVRRIKFALLALVVLWCMYWFFVAWHYWEDDAWIHLEFARSVANGQGFAFNGRVVAGDTAPLWVLLLVAIHAFLVKWIIAGKVLTVLGALVGFSGVYAFAARMARSMKNALDAALFPIAMLVLFAVGPFTCYWIFSGMEPIAGAGLACWAVLLATDELPTRPSFLTACLLAGVAPLVRPELTFLTVLLVLPLIGQWRRLQRPGRLRTLGLGALLACGPVACWAMYSLHVFGHLLPNTNAAKRAGPGDSVLRHLVSVYGLGFPLVLTGAALGIVYVLVRRERTWNSFITAVRQVWQPELPSVGLPAAAWLMILWAAIASVFYVVNHTYIQTRYILVTAPGLLVVVVAAVLMLSRSAGRVVYVLALVQALVLSVVIARPFVYNKGVDCDALARMAAFMREQLPPGAPVATYSIGEVGFLSKHPIIDTGGITRPEVIPYLAGPPLSEIPWAQSEGAQYFIGVKPQPNAQLVHWEPTVFAAWTVRPARFKEPYRVELWKLEPLR